MEDGVSSIEEAGLVTEDDSQKPSKEKGVMASVDEGILQNGSEMLTEGPKEFHNPEEVKAQDVPLLPLEESSKSLLEIEDNINGKEAGQDQKRKGVGVRKPSSTQTNHGKRDAKASQAPLKKKGEWMVNSGVVFTGELMATTHGRFEETIPNANKKAPVEKGPETPKALDPPNSARQSGGLRNSHSQFTVPQPFALATDRRASMGGHSLEAHPLSKSNSFQAARREEKKATDVKGASMKNVETLNSEKAKSAQLKASTNIFSFSSDVRAEQRKEFNSRVEERLTAKEVASKQAQAKTKEEAQAQIKEFRKSLSFKATPMPTFYQDSTPPKLEIKKIPPTRPKSPRLGRKSNTALPSCDSKLAACSGETHQENRGDKDTHIEVSVPQAQEASRKSPVAEAKTAESKGIPKRELTEEPSGTLQKASSANKDGKASTVNEDFSPALEPKKLAEGLLYDELKHEEGEVGQVVGSDKEAHAMDTMVGEGLVDVKPSRPLLAPGPLVDEGVGEQLADALPSQPKKKKESKALDSGMRIKSKLSRNPSSKTMAAQQEAKEHGTQTLKKKPASVLGATPTKNLHGSKLGGKHIMAAAVAANNGTDMAMAP